MNTPASEQAMSKTRRPVLLSILCVLNFIISGSATLLSLVGIFISRSVLQMAENMIPGVVDYSGSFFIMLFLGLFVVFALSLWGTILMFGLRKGGFVLYLIPTGLMLVFLSIMTISAFNEYFLSATAIGVIFVILFASQVKYMKE